MYLEDIKSNLLSVIHLRMERSHWKTLAVPVFNDGIDRNLNDVSILYLLRPTSEVWAAGLERGVMSSARPTVCIESVSHAEKPLVYISLSISATLSFGKKTVGTLETIERRKKVWGANDNLIEVLSARKSMVVRRAAKAALAVTTGIPEKADSSTNVFEVHLDEQVDGNASPNAAPSRDSVETEDEKSV